MSQLEEHARAYHAAGITVAPLAPGRKVPLKGDPTSAYREKPQRSEDLAGLFLRQDLNIAALTGSCSGFLTVIDVDDMAAWAELDRISLVRLLKARAPIVRTRRGCHAWILSPGPLRSTKCRRYRADIQAEGKYVVAPPSEVRQEHGAPQLYLFSGEGYRPPYRPSPAEWADLVDLFALEPLCALDSEEPAPDDTETHGLFYGLGPQALKALHEPADTGRRSEAEQVIIYRAVCIGWTLADVSELFRKEAASGTKYSAKARAGHAEKWLEAGYRAAVRHAGKTMSQDMRAINQALAALAEGLNPFSGRGAWSDASAFRVVLQVRRETRSPWIGGSLRYLADRSGLALVPFQKAIDRLEEAGALRVSRLPGSVLMAEAPEFVDTLFAKQNILTHSTRRTRGGLGGNAGDLSPTLTVHSSHDAYRYGALGKPGLELVRRLNARKGEAWSLAELAGSDIGYWYLRRVVALLESAGIVERAGSRKGAGRSATLYTCPHGLRFSDLDKVAAVAGTSGMGARQTARHAADRKAWHALKPGGACTAEL